MLRDKLWFFGPYFILLIYASTELVLHEKGSFVILYNEIHTSWLDNFFVQYTNFGDGIFAVVICLLMLFVSKRKFFTLSSALIALGAIIQLLKNTLGNTAARPRLYFEGEYLFREIPWLEPHLSNSMPSGHTASAFCLFAMLAFFSQKKSHGYMALLAAALVGFSRMYLAQHFLEDVVVGSIIGVSIASLFYIYFQKLQAGPHFNRPLIKL